MTTSDKERRGGEEDLSQQIQDTYDGLIQRVSAQSSASKDGPSRHGEGVAPGGDGGDNRPMENVARPELDAKLETIEARMDGRIARIEDRFASIDKTLATISQALETQKNVAWKAASATVAILMATIIATAALSFAAFDSGRDVANMAAEARSETVAALAEIRQIVSDLKAVK